MSSTLENSVDFRAGDHRIRVLLLAYACSPYRGGESGVGWQRALETAKKFDTWVLCKQQQYEPDIRRFLHEQGEVPGLHFCFIPRTRFEKFLKLIPGLYYTAYNRWHRRAYRLAVKLHQELHFDLVHQVNFISFREPGYLWKLDSPFIWGPVGGTQNYPWNFLRIAGIAGALKEGFRTLTNTLQLRFSRRVRQAARRAACLLTANSTNMVDFKKIYQGDPVLLLETGSKDRQVRTCERGQQNGALKILWSGALQHHKALHLLLIALSKVPAHLEYELRILGKGPLKKRLQKLAQKLGVDSHCTWMGWLPHHEAMAQYHWPDVFAFTSLRDTSGNVVLEALSHGLPVICFDHQGVRDIVTPECGIKIPVTTPEIVVQELADALVALAGNKGRVATLSQMALARAQDYLWSRNAEMVARIYQEVLAANNGRESLPEGLPHA
jgi:glycosyltransferase involved in cell wall biosynthesis